MTHYQSKRHLIPQTYESEDLVKDKVWKDEIVTKEDFAKLVECLAAWMRDMKAWGENVRDDIIRLEAAVGTAPGEPGDPPPAPRT